MKIAPDTNVLLRSFVGDDIVQMETAKSILRKAECVAISAHALCEFAWVLRSSYGVSRANVLAAIRLILDTENVVVDQAAVDAGFRAAEAGADFADGVIAYQGAWLGGETFVSFDKKAVSAVQQQALKAQLLS